MQKSAIENNPIVKHTIEFSCFIIDYCEILEASKKFVLSNQLLKSGTSIGANVIEAQNAESKVDFIHKIKIAAKEADETQYWLILCSYKPEYPDCKNLENKLIEIQKILNAILGTSKRKTPFSYLLSFFIF